MIEEKEPSEENPKHELQKVEIPEAAKKKVKGYYGFLHIRCNKCGNTHSFCSKGRINQHKCPECGKQTELSQLKRAYINCECGGIFRYFTNESEEMFDLTCLKCGQPVALNYNRKKESVRNNQRHRINNVSNLDTRKEINEQKTEKEEPGQRNH